MSLADMPTRPIPRIDPRMAQRVVEVEQGRRRHRRRLLVAAATFLLLAALTVGALYSLRVRHVRVAGAGAMTPVVLSVAGLGASTPMVSVDAAAVEHRIAAIPAVAEASVRRQWPGTVRIVVGLRVPVALLPTAGGIEVLDRTGRVLGLAARGEHLPELRLDAATAGTAPGGWVVEPGTAETALRDELSLAAALPPPLAAGIDVIAQVQGGLTAVIGRTAVDFGAGPYAVQVHALQAVMAAGPLAAGDTDLSVPDRPVLTPASSSLTGVGVQG